MIRQDYIVRAIEQFGRILAQIAGLTEQGNLEDARELASQAVKDLVGDDPEAILNLPHSALMARLMDGGPTAVVRNKCYMLATLLVRMGENFAAQEVTDRSFLCFLKALHLVLEVAPNAAEDVAPEFVPKVEELARILTAFQLPGATRLALMQYYESAGNYGKAEDMLHGLLETEEGGGEMLELGKGFYRRLLGKTDDDLATGNLPRVEVEAGLKEIEAGKS